MYPQTSSGLCVQSFEKAMCLACGLVRAPNGNVLHFVVHTWLKTCVRLHANSLEEIVISNFYCPGV